MRNWKVVGSRKLRLLAITIWANLEKKSLSKQVFTYILANLKFDNIVYKKPTFSEGEPRNGVVLFVGSVVRWSDTGFWSSWQSPCGKAGKKKHQRMDQKSENQKFDKILWKQLSENERPGMGGGTFCRSGGRISDFEALGNHHAAKPEQWLSGFYRSTFKLKQISFVEF